IANPSVRVGAHNAVSGMLIYIEHVEVGRTLPSYGQPARVGGTIVKRGCALAPVVQIVTPLPAGLAIHGDATGVTLRVTQPGGVQPLELAEAGRVLLQAQPGLTRIDAADDSLGAAWVIAADTPYYAITDDRGRFRIDELAAGTYDVTFFGPPLAGTANGKLVYGPPVITHRSIKVDPDRPARLDVVLGR
ncbi:MAG TPA: carboxypeptidase-like regulatory domain-containing protein, partial [Kofleriaceae bacterium]|nr:carboxypeptidase-like regulatory domain-containing protein [Kofleriaceae bacterium]